MTIGVDPDLVQRDIRAYNEVIGSVATDSGSAVVDMERLLTGDPDAFVDTVHHST